MNDVKLTSPIPIDLQPWDWTLAHQPAIQENNDPLINAGYYPERILTSAEYFNQNIKGSLPNTFIRQKAYQKLVQASRLLSNGYKLLLLDVWRSNQAQQTLFDILKRNLAKHHPELSENELMKRVLTTVAPPSANSQQQPSPHNTGGAIDLMIVDSTGLPLSFGTPFDDPTAVARTAYFEEQLSRRHLTAKEQIYLNNRRLLFNVMTSVGFTNYTDEWWHYDFGNQNWAWKSNHDHAIYGTIEPKFMWQNPLVD